MKAWLCPVALYVAAAGIACGQDDDPAAGERLFRLHCAECHGLDGEGGANGAICTPFSVAP